MTNTYCPLVKSHHTVSRELWKFHGFTLATALAFGAGLTFALTGLLL